MDLQELEKNTLAKEIELTKMCEIDAFENSATLPPLELLNLNFWNNVHEFPSFNQNFDCLYNQPHVSADLLSKNFEQLYIAANNYPSSTLDYHPQITNYLADFDRTLTYQGTCLNPNKSFSNNPPAHFKSGSNSGSNNMNRKRYNRKNQYNKNRYRQTKDLYHNVDWDKVVIDIDIDKLQSLWKSNVNPNEQEAQNMFWNMFIYLDEVKEERFTIQKLIECTNDEFEENHKPNRAQILKQNYEHALKHIEDEINKSNCVLNMLKVFYRSDLMDGIVKAEVSLGDLGTSHNKFDFVGRRLFKNHVNKQMLQTYEGNGNFNNFKDALSKLILCLRRFGLNMFILKHNITKLTNGQDRLSTRNIFRGS